MARTHKMDALKAREQGIRFRRIMRYDEGFLVNWGESRAQEGARRGRLTPNLAREYARTHEAIEEVLMADYITPAQEEAEDAYLQARIEDRAREVREEQEDYCYVLKHDQGDPYPFMYEPEFFDWEAEKAAWAEECRQENHAWEVMTLARTMIQHPPLHP